MQLICNGTSKHTYNALMLFQESSYSIPIIICDALRDLVPFAHIKKREKHPWNSVTFRLKKV